MKSQMKKYVSLMLALIIISVSNGVFASFPDVPSTAFYYDAVKNLEALGIISGNEKGEFRPDDFLTREQFARLIIAVAGEDYKADVLKDMVNFPDVKPSRWSNGYINAAVEMGYIKGMLDGKFHPAESVTLAQVCTVLVKMLGYNDNDLSGTWPQNYLIKAKEAQITKGLSFSTNDPLPRWAVVVMIDNLLAVPSKSDPSKTYAQTNKYFTEYIILATSETSDEIADNEVFTDKGTFFIGDSKLSFKPGNKYRLNIKSDTILSIHSHFNTSSNISVESASGTLVTYRDGNEIKSINLPSKTVYYYNGKVQSYDKISSILQVNSSVVLNKNNSGSGYEYGVIFDPIYSKPQVALSYNMSLSSIGNIKFEEGVKIAKNGQIAATSQIEEKDVVYQVSDIWNINKYILVLDDKISGEITQILPNKISPKFVKINDVSYELGEYMNIGKINSQGTINVNDSVTALLGHDGKIVDIVMNSFEDNSHFALVLNNYTQTDNSTQDFGKEIDFVKLLHTDNTVKTYKLKNSETGFNGQLVKFEVVAAEDDDGFETVKLERLDYLNAKEYTIYKDKKMLNENYFSDNIKIFNVVSTVFGADSDAYLMDVSKLPDGLIQAGKVKYINKTGDFEDINIILVENLLDEGLCQGIITKVSEKVDSRQDSTMYNYSVLIMGKEYSYSANSKIEGAYSGAVIQVVLKNDKILSVERIINPWVESAKVIAIDSTRIKINEKIYQLKSGAVVYFRDYNGSFTRKGTNDIVPGKIYGKVSLYLDKSLKYDGKVEMIIVTP